MARAEIVDRSSIEVLLDDCWRDIRIPSDGRCISELLRDAVHDGSDRSLLLRFGRRDSLLGRGFREVDRRKEGATPGPEVLGGELLPEVDLYVVVQALAREVAEGRPPSGT